jgi:hypothetical protein
MYAGLDKAASWTMGYPHPYFVGKLLVFFGLRAWLRCKILTTKKFLAKSSKQMSYARFKEALNKFPGNASIFSGAKQVAEKG